MRRASLALFAVLALCAAAAPPAFGHAGLATSAPADRASLATAPTRVVLRFSEPVELLRPSDVSVVDEKGVRVSRNTARTSPRDASIVEVGLPPTGLPAQSYTVRYRIVSADAHIIDGATTFATGGAALKGAVLGSLESGPGETSVWSVISRFLELIGLGGALALVAFRWLVWRPAWRWRERVAPGEDDDMLGWSRGRFWTAFWSLIGVALLGEVAVLVTKTGISLGESPFAALGDPSGVYRVFSETRFGVHFQVRVGVLLFVIAVAFWEYLAEPVAEQERGERAPAGRAVAGGLIAGLLVACLALLSSQGHASQAPAGALSVADDALHLTSVAVWVGGLAALAIVLRHVPTILGTAVLSRFSGVALAAVGVAVLTGTARAVGELSDPAQLWDTAYGRSIVIKVALLLPLAALALQNRRVLTAIAARGRANRATLRMITRNARVELGLSLGIVLVASLLVAQVPGRL